MFVCCFFSSRIRHTRCSLVTGVQTCALPIYRLATSELNYRANIAALKMAGCTDVLSISACGSFREDLSPGTFVLVDQYVDRTRERVKSFFGDGIVAQDRTSVG